MAEKSLPISGRITQTVISVGTTAVQIPTTNLHLRRIIIVTNFSTNTIYIGNSSVSNSGANRGFPLPNQFDNVRIELSEDVNLFAVSSAASSDVGVVEGQ